jgi:hypothetical protein
MDEVRAQMRPSFLVALTHCLDLGFGSICELIAQTPPADQEE